MALELDARRIQKLMSFMLIAQSHMSLLGSFGWPSMLVAS